MKKVFVLAGLVALVLGRFSAPADAAILVNGWDINLEAVAGQNMAGFGQVEDIHLISFNGISHSHLHDSNPNGFPDIGERAIVDGLLTALTFTNSTSNTTFSSTGKGLGFHFEFTFDFSLASKVTKLEDDGAGGFNQSFIHLGPGEEVGGTPIDGLLDLYIENLSPGGGTNPDGVAQTNIDGANAGEGFRGGRKVATFEVLAGDGGVFNTRTLNGNDAGTFRLISADSGVFTDAMGNDLGLLVASGTPVLLTLTDSLFDADPDTSSGVAGSPDSVAAKWPTMPGGSDSGSLSDFFAFESGTAKFAVTPEPTSLAVFLLGLPFAGLALRRRK